MKSIILALVVLVSISNAHAADWNSAFWLGLSYGGSSNSNIMNDAGTSLAAVKTDGKAAPAFGAEWFRRTDFPINLALIFDNTWYGNDGSKNDDTLSLMIAPRFETGGLVSAWAEIGVGPSLTFIGTTAETVGGVTTTLDSSTMFAFLISPRVGIDIKVNEKWFVGLQAAYYIGAGSVGGTVSVGGASGHFKEDVSRHWMTTGIRFGYSLGSDEEKPAPVTAAAPIPPMPPADNTAAADAPKKIDADELMKLKKLRDAHAITEKEYQDQKAKILK
jgi:hypothetical protein